MTYRKSIDNWSPRRPGLGPPDDASPEEIRRYRYEKLKAELDRKNGTDGGDPTEGMSRLDHLLVGAGRGFTDLGQGAKQLGLNVGAKLGLVVYVEIFRTGPAAKSEHCNLRQANLR